MAKIIAISGTVVSIGTENGSIEEVRADDLNFVPHIGDEVEIFRTETKVIVSKKEAPAAAIPNGGININVQNTQTQNAATPTVIAIQGKVVNKIVYCVLAFFLGGIGVHKFYAGKTGVGLAMLFLCWTLVPSIIALVDFIVALTKKADANGNIIV